MNRATLSLLLLSASAFAATLQAQSLTIINTTPPPADARFAIIQGTVSIFQAVLKLDRYTGQVWNFSHGVGPWKPMKVVGLPTIAAPKTARFQMLWLFGGQGTSKQTLLDCHTGQTWQLGGVDEWRPDGEPKPDGGDAAEATK